MPRIASPASASDATVTIDGYNVLLTLYHYSTGYPVFLCRDGLVRDAGLSHGRSARPERLEEVARRLFGTLCTGAPPKTLRIILDEAVTHSRDHAALLRAAWGTVAVENRVPGFDLYLSSAADADLAAVAEGFLATSDSQVIERSTLPVLDLPRWVLEESFGVTVPGVPTAGYRGGR